MYARKTQYTVYFTHSFLYRPNTCCSNIRSSQYVIFQIINNQNVFNNDHFHSWLQCIIADYITMQQKTCNSKRWIYNTNSVKALCAINNIFFSFLLYSSFWHHSTVSPYVRSSSICNLLPLLGLTFILPSMIPHSRTSCLKMWPIQQHFHCHMAFDVCLSSFNLLSKSSLVTFSIQLILSVLLYIHISKASNLRLSTWVSVRVSALTI